MSMIKIKWMFCLFFISFSTLAMVDNMKDNVGVQSLTSHRLLTQIFPSQSLDNSNNIDKSNNIVVNKVTSLQFKQMQFGNNFSGSAFYHYGRFSAATGISSKSIEPYENTNFYLQSSLVVFNWKRFNVALSARVDNIDHFSGSSTQFDDQNIYLDQNNIASATLGVIGSYSLSKKWKVTGAITTTSVMYNAQTNALLSNFNQNNNSEKMAIIGTSYSF